MDTETSRLPDMGGRSSEYESLDDWKPLDLTLYADGKIPPPSRLPRTDGANLLYRGKSHTFVGESGSLKTFGALLAVKDFLRRGENVAYVDMESDPMTMVGRLRGMGLNIDDLVEQGFLYIRPISRLTEAKFEALQAFLRSYWDIALLVVDGVTEFMALHNWDVNDGADVARFQNALPKRWPGDVTTLTVDHVPHGGSRALGSQHKKAGIDGASYLFKSVEKGAWGGTSIAQIVMGKDRDGRTGVPDGDVAGFLVVDSTDERRWQVQIQTPDEFDAWKQLQKQTAEARRTQTDAMVALELIEIEPRSSRDLQSLMEVGRAKVDAATASLVGGGLIQRDPRGGRNAKWVRA